MKEDFDDSFQFTWLQIALYDGIKEYIIILMSEWT